MSRHQVEGVAGLPAGMPALGPGKHSNPRQGACVMEYTALLAGERFSDQPRCTHPALGELARQVNDRLSTTARAGLARRAPALAAIGPRVPGVAAAAAAAALAGTAAHAPGPFSVARAERRLAGLQARDRPGRGYWGRRRDMVAAYHLITVGLDRTRDALGI